MPSHDERVTRLAQWEAACPSEVSTTDGIERDDQRLDAMVLRRLSKFIEDVSFSNCLEQREEDVFEASRP